MGITKTVAAEDELFGMHPTAINDLIVYPNPGDHLLQVQWNAAKNSQVVLKIVDMSGRLVVLQEYEIPAGKNVVSFDMTAQPSGVYAILLQSTDEVMSVKWIKDK
jgi:hypothetical protein